MKNKAILAILLFALALRLYHIDFPICGYHAWRQADTAAMAINFYENGFHLFTPQIDWGGNSAGYVETEFPIYSYLVSLCDLLTGPMDFWGRLISVVLSIATIYGLYLLVRKFIDEKTALLAALFYAVIPLSIYYSRTVMPESGMLMCSVYGLYFFSEWIDTGTARAYLASLFFLTMAALLKLPALYLGLPAVFLAQSKFGGGVFKQWRLWLFAGILVVPVALWYYHAHEIFKASGLTFGIWDFGKGKWGNVSPLLTVKFYNDIFFKSIAERHLTYPGFIFFVAGLFVPRKSKRERVFDWWLVAVLVYFGIVATGNQIHEYYQLPFILPAAVFAGKSLAWCFASEPLGAKFGKNKTVLSLACLLAVAIPILSAIRYTDYMKAETVDQPLFRLGAAVQSATASDDLVVAVDEGDPVILYRCGRKGWHASADELSAQSLHTRQTDGAKYLVGLKSSFDDAKRNASLARLLREDSVVVQTNEYFIVSFAQR
jgi:4-amino-4-deoxy-L-arabinose transferase-like glycosyltransferase